VHKRACRRSRTLPPFSRTVALAVHREHGGAAVNSRPLATQLDYTSSRRGVQGRQRRARRRDRRPCLAPRFRRPRRSSLVWRHRRSRGARAVGRHGVPGPDPACVHVHGWRRDAVRDAGASSAAPPSARISGT
jgi:hypothetical protein